MNRPCNWPLIGARKEDVESGGQEQITYLGCVRLLTLLDNKSEGDALLQI